MTRPITLFLAALALAVAVPAAAQEGTLKKIRDSGSITIGHRDASIPFSSTTTSSSRSATRSSCA